MFKINAFYQRPEQLYIIYYSFVGNVNFDKIPTLFEMYEDNEILYLQVVAWYLVENQSISFWVTYIPFLKRKLHLLICWSYCILFTFILFAILWRIQTPPICLAAFLLLRLKETRQARQNLDAVQDPSRLGESQNVTVMINQRFAKSS